MQTSQRDLRLAAVDALLLKPATREVRKMVKSSAFEMVGVIL